MMVLEFLTAGHVPGRGVCLPGQNDEPEPPVVKNGTHRNQGVLPHSGPRARQVVRQQIERVDCIEIIDCNRDRAVGMTGEQYRKRCPGRPDVGSMQDQRFVHVGSKAIDVDV